MSPGHPAGSRAVALTFDDGPDPRSSRSSTRGVQRDWRRPGVDEIVRRVQRQVAPGAVVLLHDGGGRRDQTVDALELLLPWLAENCYRITFPTP